MRVIDRKDKKPYNDAPVQPQRTLRVTRTLVYEGPEDWVRHTLELSWVQPDEGKPGGGKYVTEALREEEFLS